MKEDESLPASPSSFQVEAVTFSCQVLFAHAVPLIATHMQAAAAYIRANKNCLAGGWPQLAALLSVFCDANDAAPSCSHTGQCSDVVCLVELVEALPYTEHAALLVLKVSVGETVFSLTHVGLPVAETCTLPDKCLQNARTRRSRPSRWQVRHVSNASLVTSYDKDVTQDLA